MSQKNTNKRRSERLFCHVPVEGKEGEIFDRVKTIDLSKGGVGFISQKEIPINKEIPMELDLDDQESSIFVLGKVKWVNPLEGSSQFRVGLSFESVFEGSKSRFNQYFSTNNMRKQYVFEYARSRR